MSFETACFNGYAEEFLEVQMADAVAFKLSAEGTLQGVWREAAPLLCAPRDDIKLAL